MYLDQPFDHEAARIIALDRYDVLDSKPEERFDRITKIVQIALDVPITAISLVDEKRQWFKSKHGLGVDETPREVAFCAHTIKNSQAFAIEDASKDRRFSNNPLVTGEPNIKSYLGIPLLSPDGFNIGTLCAIDTVPRKFDSKSVELMNHLAKVVIHELEMRQRLDRDPLTGALTRSAFSKDVREAITLFSKQKIPSTLILLDLENFKWIHDNFGFTIGDEILRSVSENVIETLRLSDSFGRVGGEEFAILMTGISHQESLLVTERIEDIIETGTFGRIETLKISANFGIAPLSEDHDSVEKWFGVASSRLRAAKRI